MREGRALMRQGRTREGERWMTVVVGWGDGMGGGRWVGGG